MKARIWLHLIVLVALLLPALPATPAWAQSHYVVNSLGDGSDANAPDGICDVDLGTPGDQCTLRAALDEWGLGSADTTITFKVVGVITLTSALPKVLHTSSLEVTGPGPSELTIDGLGSYRLFSLGVSAPGSATITGLTLANGFNNTTNGGAIENLGNLTLERMTIVDGRAEYGGGIYNAGSLTLRDSILRGNMSAYDGGGIYNATGSSAELTNVVLSANSGAHGGAIFNEGSSPYLTNVTISANNVDAIYNGSDSHPTLTNCILWDDGVEIFNDGSSTASVTYSLVQGGYPGMGNIGADPLFVNPPAGFPGSENDDLRLTLSSPAIDAGDNSAVPVGITTDLGGHPRFAGTVDMGAYEAPPSLLYVDHEAAGNNDGSSWTDALTNLQHALTWTVKGVEIWVAAGIYTPGNSRGDSFQLKNDVAVYGGFAGDEESLEQRNWVLNPTTLSGDIGAPEDNTDNVYHVVTTVYTDTATTVLDGFTITGGYADGGGYSDDGGGMVIYGADLIVSHVTFSDNHAAGNGGGLVIGSSASPTLTDVIFIENTATWGGGLHNSESSSPTLVGATFTANEATHGGAIYNGAVLTLSNALISESTAIGDGGGIYNVGVSELNNVTLSGNHADDRGGGIFNGLGPAGLPGMQVTFKDNTAIGSGGGLHNEDGEVELYASTFSGNMAGSTGGGIANVAGDVKLYDTALSDNFATAQGGGLYTTGATGHTTLHGCTVDHNATNGDGGGAHSEGWLTLLNSTVSSNKAADYGGGLRTVGIWTGLHNVTLTENRADSNDDATGDGGGLYFEGGTVVISNTIIAANQDSMVGDVHPDYACTFAGEWSFNVEHSLFGDGTGCLELIETGPGNLAGDGDTPLDPRLYRLADNGGPTLTHALIGDSPARDAGNPAGCKDQFGTPMPYDQRGFLRSQEGDGADPAVCDMGAYEASLGNDAWTHALRLEVSDIPYWDAADQYLDIPGQSRWYKFQVQPGSRVTVELDPGNANLDLVFYQDILAAYERLEDLTQASDLVSLTAEFAADAFAPDSYAADAFSSEAYAPMAFSPMAFSPMAFSPMAFSPMAFSPMAFSPMAFSPMAFSPMAFSPMAFSPMAFSPMAFSPDNVVLDDAYSVAQMLTIVGVSAFDGLASESITVNTWDNSGDFYVRVTGRNGAFDPPVPPHFESVPFHLEVAQEVGVCAEVELIKRAEAPAVEPGAWETLILVDWQRMGLNPEGPSELHTALDAFATQVGGVVVNVGADLLVAEANTEAGDPANVACPFAKNQVARLIKDIVNAYRQANPETLKYVVIVGGDEVIPFFRHPDRALLANEKNYIPPVFNDTASFASLHRGYVLSQDYYGSAVDLSLSNTILPVPKLAVGRLVETPSEIIALLEAYADLGGGALVPHSAFVSGYDFLTDAAREVSNELAAGTGSNVDELICDADVSPLDPAAWRADQLRDGLLSRRHDVIFLAGHFSASGALAADFQTHLSAAELAGSAVDLRNALIFSAGCHSGYNIVTEHGIPDVTAEPDWAQAFAQKGATFVGGTGYQYGDTDFLEYSERLYLEFAKHLRYGTGPVTVGEALVGAKQAYLAGTAEMRGIHEKALLEATLFGLPMLPVDMPQGRGDPPVPPSIVSGTTGFPAPGPGASLGLRYADVTVDSDLTPHTVTLYSVDDLGADPPVTIDVHYFSGTDGVVVNPVEPVLPLERRNVSVPGLVLRGIGIRGASYTDQAGLIPLTGAATTELRGVHPPFFSDVFYPIKPWRANFFDALADPLNGITWLHVTPSQFISPDLDDWAGILRTFSSMDLRLYYSDNTTTYPNGAVPALSAAPTIARVLATEENGQVTFNAWVVGDPAAGIQEVWVTYTGASCDPGAVCTWQSLDLTQDAADSTLWTGVLNAAAPGDLRYIVQAFNGAGLGSLADNLGHYFRVGVDPADPSIGEDPAGTDLELQSPASTGAYSTEETFTAWLTSNGDPVAGQKIQFALGAQERWATTDDNGYATVKIPLLGPPGEHRLLASFAGNVEYGRSSAVASFTIQKQGTQLQLVPQTASSGYGIDAYGIDAVLVAKLTDAADRPLREKSLGFVVDVDSANAADDYAFTGITDLTGQVLLGPSSLPQGNYTLSVYFGREVLLPSGAFLELSDVNYADSEASHIVGDAPALWGITIDPSPIAVGTLIEPFASFAYPGPAASLRAVWDWGDGSFSEGTVDDTNSTVSGSHTYTAPGVYTLRLVLADQNGACDEAIYQYVVVYDDSQGFVTGGGWIDSPAGAYPADPELTGRANFGFVAKYRKGVDVPIGQTEFQFQAGDLNFHSDSYEWLRVARHKAMFKGEGTINGTGNYGFMLSAIDADLTPSTTVDFFRIKIWNTGTEEIVYDNQVGEDEDADPTTALGGGDIVIHAR